MAGTIGSEAANPEEVERVWSARAQSLHEREITFAALARIAPVGILRFDAEGRCNYVNRRWQEMAGFTIDEAIGEGWLEAVHPEDRADVLARWSSMRVVDELFREEYRLRRRDGEVRWVLAEGAALRDYSGEPLGFIRAVTDITRHREMEAELTAAREALEQRVRERTADLEAEMAERQRLEREILEARDQEQRRFSEDLHDGLGQYLIGILFRLAALQQDLAETKSPLEPAVAEITALVNDVSRQAHDLVRGVDPVPMRADGLATALQELVEELGAPGLVDCRFECEEPVNIEDHAVATHLYRVAQEAVTNALKHSGASNITVRLQHDGNDACKLLVEDDGSGIDGDRQKQTGHGLNIMKHRASLIDAQLELQSAAGTGTLISCRFQPRRRQDP